MQGRALIAFCRTREWRIGNAGTRFRCAIDLETNTLGENNQPQWETIRSVDPDDDLPQVGDPSMQTPKMRCNWHRSSVAHRFDSERQSTGSIVEFIHTERHLRLDRLGRTSGHLGRQGCGAALVSCTMSTCGTFRTSDLHRCTSAIGGKADMT